MIGEYYFRLDWWIVDDGVSRECIVKDYVIGEVFVEVNEEFNWIGFFD